MFYINEKIRIKKMDERCLLVEILREAKDKRSGTTTVKWMSEGYYGSLKGALVSILNKKLFDTTDEETKLTNVVRKINSAEGEIEEAVNRILTSGELINLLTKQDKNVLKDDEKVSSAAITILEKYRPAFEELSE